MDLSVIIPTRGRPERLQRTLSAIAAQDRSDFSAEVLVVQNASRDDLSAAMAVLDGIPASLLFEAAPGTANALNTGLASARGAVVLFLGDDTRPRSKELLGGHLKLHTASPAETYAVVGGIEWDPEEEVTEFMRWLVRAGFQFAVDTEAPGPVSPSRFFHTAHASAKRSVIESSGGFDPAFPFMFEHVDLGIRLEQAGVTLDYRPELLVLHAHPLTPPDYARRMAAVGRAARSLRARWEGRAPAEVLGPGAKWPLYLAAELPARVALGAGARGRLRERCWSTRMMSAYVRGYIRGGVPTASS